MASANRQKAKEIFLEHKGNITNRKIAEMLDEKEKTISAWKSRGKWNVVLQEKECSTTANQCSTTKKRGAPNGNNNAVGHGAPKGNKNAVGNNGGAPKGNKNAVTTGEYETIWFDTLTEQEQGLFGKIDTSALVQAEQGIIFTTFRERRMMERIKRLMDGLTEKERRIVSELREEKQVVEMYDEKTASSKTVIVPVPRMVVTSVTETQPKVIDEILRIEDGLTRVQQQKARFIALKHSIENDAKGEGGDIAKEHAQRLQEVWANR